MNSNETRVINAILFTANNLTLNEFVYKEI